LPSLRRSSCHRHHFVVSRYGWVTGEYSKTEKA
jgi:hypothetical protein